MDWKLGGLIAALALAPMSGHAIPVCDDVAAAGIDLEAAAADLYRCAARHDYARDCRREFKVVDGAASEYESAVSEADGVLDGDAASVCGVPVHVGVDGRMHSL